MRFAFMSFSCPDLSLEQMLTKADALGYDGIELRLSSGHRHGVEVTCAPEARQVVRETVARHKADICCLASSLQFAVETKTEETVAEAEEIIDLAADLGVRCVRSFGGGIPEDANRDAARECAVSALKRVAPYAEQKNVCLCMETHDDWRDPHDMRSIVEPVDSPAVGVNWDFFHCVRGGGGVKAYTVRESYEVLKSWIRHCHIHDALKDGGWAPMGEGFVDHREAMACLESDGYTGYMSGEWIGWDKKPKHLQDEIERLRTMAPDTK